MALAEMKHHTGPRGQNMARAGEKDHEMNYTATVRHLLLQVAGTVYFELEQIVDSVSGLPILDAFVPQMAPDWVQDPALQRLRGNFS